VRPLIEIPTEPEPPPVAAQPPIESAAFQVEPFPAPTPAEQSFTVEPFPAPPVKEAAPEAKLNASEQVTIVTPSTTPPAKEGIVIDSAPPPMEARSAARLTETGPAPKSAASETVVSQRGNTLQVPKVAPTTLGKPPQPIAPQPRKAQRTGEGGGGSLDWQLIGMIAGTVVLGVIGFVMILAALAG
jgi:hypothetical protein